MGIIVHQINYENRDEDCNQTSIETGIIVNQASLSENCEETHSSEVMMTGVIVNDSAPNCDSTGDSAIKMTGIIVQDAVPECDTDSSVVKMAGVIVHESVPDCNPASVQMTGIIVNEADKHSHKHCESTEIMMTGVIIHEAHHRKQEDSDDSADVCQTEDNIIATGIIIHE